MVGGTSCVTQRERGKEGLSSWLAGHLEEAELVAAGQLDRGNGFEAQGPRLEVGLILQSQR